MGGVHVCTPVDASIGFPMSAVPLYARRTMEVKALLHVYQGTPHCIRAFPCAVKRYCCKRLLGLPGMVFSINPACSSLTIDAL